MTELARTVDGKHIVLFEDGTWSEIVGGTDKFGNRHHVVRNGWLDNPILRAADNNPYRDWIDSNA